MYIYIYLFLRQFLVYISQVRFLVRFGIKIGRSLLYDFFSNLKVEKKKNSRILLDDGIEERADAATNVRCTHEF